MNKLILSGSLFFLFFLCNIASVAQEFSSEVDEKFMRYNRTGTTEKLFVHTDKNVYLAGEIIWFKIYYVDGTSHKPLDLSKVGYVEIVDQDAKPVLQAKIALAEGSGSGSLFLPLSLNSGVYTLRAYTQWMRNSSADYFFERTLTIVNSTKNLQPRTREAAHYSIAFFPEGGNLVQNLESKLAFKVARQGGKGTNFRGTIVNQQNDSVASFEPLKFGIGHLKFTPRQGDQYRAVIMLNDTAIVSQLPQVREQGYVMNVSREAGEKIRVKVVSTNQSSHPVHLVVHTRHIQKVAEQKLLTNGTVEFMIDKNKLGEGISHITVLNEDKMPLCERLFFVQPAARLNLETNAIPAQLTSRKKVDIEVSSKDDKGKPVLSDLSVAVYDLGADSLYTGPDITSYFWLSSDLHGDIESPGFYFSEKSKMVDEAADNLMLTHGWRRFVWRETEKKKDSVDFIPEYRGHIISARITDARTGLPAGDVVTYLSVPGKRVQLYNSRSDAEGRLKFYTKDFYGRNEILLQTDSRLGGSYKIEITNPFSDKVSSRSLPVFELPESAKTPLIDHNVSMQVQNIFAGDKLQQLYAPLIDSHGFYGAPDNYYMLDNFVRFSTMEEVLREYVVEVLVRRQKENFRLMIAGGLENRVFMDDPITLFNSVPIFETNKIMQYNPLKVEKIEVVKRRYFYGPSTLNGIVNFVTYEPDATMLSGINAVVFDYEGLQYEREFYSPTYDSPDKLNSRLPDFRNVLYWSPTVKTGADGKAAFNFYTSDLKGRYLVVIQGLNADGNTGSRFATFSVK